VPPDRDAPTVVSGGPPKLPAPDDCSAAEPGELFPPPFMGKVELRLHPDDSRFLDGVRTGTALIRGWFRLRGDEPTDTIALLTAHVRRRPAPGWLAVAVRTRFVDAGFLEVDGEFWDSDGSLVAQSRQLALVPRPGG